jgi:hypothetical protein
LLASLRGTFAQVPRGVPFDLTLESDGEPISLSLTEEDLRWLTNGDSSCKTWEIFVDALLQNADRDGILNAPAEGGEGPGRTVTKLLEALKAWSAAPSERSVSIARRCARNLISLLPILRHWDLYGAIRHAWAPGSKEPPHSLWQELGRAREPFYCNHFVYYPPSTGTYPTSKDVLKYEISAEAVFTDLARINPDPVWIAPRDYFDYAYPPDKEELPHYRIYSFFMDTLQLALSSPTAKSQQDLYYIAYPVFSGLSRRHFLHIYVRPNAPDASLKDLWQAWREWHPFLNWDDLRRLLVDELEQVDLARFQTRVIEKIEKYCKQQRVQDHKEETEGAALCRSQVADQLHLLFPVRCACTDGRIGLYEVSPKGDTLPGTVPWNNLGPPGTLDKDVLRTMTCKGEIGTSASCERVRSGPASQAKLLWDEQLLGPHSSVQAEIARGRRERLVAQQLEFANMIWKSHKGTRIQTETENKRKWSELRPLLVKKKNDLLTEICKTAGSFKDRFNADSIRNVLGCDNLPELFQPYFYLESLDPKDESAWKAVFREIASSSLHRLVSEYIETGVVRWLTHTPRIGEPTTLRAPDLLAEHEGRWQALRTALEGQAAHGLAYKRLQTLSSAVQGYLKEAGDIEGGKTKVGDQLSELRRVLRPKIACGTGAGRVAAHDFLKLNNLDEVVTDVVRVDLPSPCFGVLETVWNEALQSFRCSQDGSVKLFAGFVEGSKTTIAVPSICHPGDCQNIPFYAVYVLIGNVMQDAEPNERLPERFNKLKDLLLGLGEVFWLTHSSGNWSMRRLPDLCPGDVPACLPERLRRLTNDGEGVEFIVSVLERYEIP